MTRDASRCHRCGRAVAPGNGTGYVYGIICNRADCHRVNQALSPRFAWFWFKTRLPTQDSPGRAASYTLDGEPQTPRGMTEPSTMRALEADGLVQPGQGVP